MDICERLTPVGMDPEREMIACIIKDPTLYDMACGMGVTDKTFFAAMYRDIWQAFGKAANDGKPLNDTLTLKRYCQFADYADIEEIRFSISSTVWVKNVIENLKEFEGERVMLNGMSSVMGSMSRGDYRLDVARENLENLLLDVQKIYNGLQIKPLIAVGKELHDQITTPPPIIPLFPANTEAGDALKLHAGELMVVGARTGSGKTALAAQMANHALESGCNVMYVCVESSSSDIFARIVAAESGISHYRLINGECNDNEKFEFERVHLEMLRKYANSLAVIGCDRNVITAERIVQSIRSWMVKVGHVDLVIVDFLQGMSLPPDRRSRLEKLDESIMLLHDTFIEQRCAGIMLSQFNREMQKVKQGEKQPAPDLTWLKDTSTLEQLAHTVAFLYKPDKDVNLTHFYSQKTRNQRPFSVQLEWRGAGYQSKSRF